MPSMNLGASFFITEQSNLRGFVIRFEIFYGLKKTVKNCSGGWIWNVGVRTMGLLDLKIRI